MEEMRGRCPPPDAGRRIAVATRDRPRYLVVKLIMRVDQWIGAFLRNAAEGTIVVPSA